MLASAAVRQRGRHVILLAVAAGCAGPPPVAPVAPAREAPVTIDDGAVVGVLRHEHGHGYFVDSMPSRVWLYISENKIQVRELQELQGKRVRMKGVIKTMPANSGASVPPGDRYVEEYTIEAAGP